MFQQCCTGLSKFIKQIHHDFKDGQVINTKWSLANRNSLVEQTVITILWHVKTLKGT